MRLLLVSATLIAILGCRTPQEAFHAHSGSASNWQMETPLPTVTSSLESHRGSIEELVDFGLANSPRVQQAVRKVQSLRYRIPQELSLPDPVLSTTTHLSPVETAAGRQAFALGINQTFVDAERRAAKAAIANDQVRVAMSEVESVQQQLAEQIRIAAFQLLAVRETLKLVEQEVRVLAQIEELVLRKFEVDPAVSQQQVLLVQTEQSRVEIQVTGLHQQERSHSARLARLAHLPQGTSIELTDTLDPVSHESDVDSLLATAFQARPELQSQLNRVQIERRRVWLAERQKRPDVTVGLNWIMTSPEGISPVADGSDALLLGVGFNLPVRNERIDAAKSEACLSRLSMVAELESIEDQIAEEVFDTYTKLESSEMTVSLLEDDILPKSERMLELAIEEYADGNTELTQLLETWRSMLRSRIAVVNLHSQRQQLRATLARQIGHLKPSPGLPDSSVTESASAESTSELVPQELPF
ncbi:MAG: TolC family protein [Planctomycetota bacterium]